MDGYGLLAIFVAACYSWAAARRRATLVVSAFAVVAVALSVAQMIQHWNHILPIADTTWDQCRGLFLRWP